MKNALADQPYEPARRVLVNLDGPASCSCCGAESTPSHPVYVANLYDVDCDFHARLCVSCFDTIEADITASYEPASTITDYGREQRFLGRLGTELLDEPDVVAFVGDMLSPRAA